MSSVKKIISLAVRVGSVLFALGAGLLAVSCGSNGKIYGEVAWDGNLDYASIGGFPSSGNAFTYYEIMPGSYTVYYTVDDGTQYYPGPDPSYFYTAQYTVEADKGSFPFVNGTDHHFDILLGYTGMRKVGDVKSTLAPLSGPQRAAPMLGTQKWAEDGLLITVTNNIVKLTSTDLSRVQRTFMEKK